MKKFALPLLVLLAFAAGISAALVMKPGEKTPPDVEGLLWPNPRALQAFSLVDQDGDTFDLQQLKGQWTMLFFGYTYCPDVCPSTLATLHQVKDDLGERSPRTVFVSVDPMRDSPQRLGEYVRFFDPSFVGVTGSEDALKALTMQLGVIAFKTEPDEDGYYLVDHTAAVLLLDPQARLVGLFRTPHEAGDIAERVSAIKSFVES